MANLRLFPVPASDYQLFLLSEKSLDEVQTLDTDLELPAGWEDAIIFNLAMRLAPEYGQSVSPELKMFADQALRNIRAAVLKNRSLDAGAGGYKRNVYDGWTR